MNDKFEKIIEQISRIIPFASMLAIAVLAISLLALSLPQIASA